MKVENVKRIYLNDTDFLHMIENYLNIKAGKDKFEIQINGQMVPFGMYPKVSVEIDVESSAEFDLQKDE